MLSPFICSYSTPRLFWLYPCLSSRAILLLCLAISTLLFACKQTPTFHHTDITGLSYARDFELKDTEDKVRRIADFRGKIPIIFFGYTSCPDVCPLTLGELQLLLQALSPEQAQQLQIIFITLDPARDTPQLLKQYLSQYHPSFIGLRGEADANRKTNEEFRIVSNKIPGTTPNNYTIDHSAAAYVYDRQGRVRLFLRLGNMGNNTSTLPNLVADISTLLQE